MFSSMLSLLGSLRRGNFVLKSLRFRSSASAYLSKTFAAPTSSTIFTWSAWVKRGALTGTYRLFGASTNTFLTFNSADQLNLTLNGTSAATSTAVFRDPSAWYHIVYAQNGANQTLYVNQTPVATGTTANTVFNTAIAHQIGAANAANFFDGYLTEINFIDGQALTPASFGQIESTTGVWSPNQYVGAYGTNGFYLKFADASAATAAAIGKDSSGNGNNWTPSGISVTAGATYDSMFDVPVNYSDSENGRGNYAVLNPLVTGTAGVAISDGNLKATFSASVARGIPFPKSTTPVYCEFTISGGDAWGGLNMLYRSNGDRYNGTTYVPYGASYTAGDIIGCAYNPVSETVEFFKNNVSQGVVPAFATTSVDIQVYGNGGSISVTYNFGQRPFQNTTTWNTLKASGYRALNTNSLSTPSIVNGANFMAATTYAGIGANQSLSNSINNISFQPNLVWIKSRTPGATSHALFDTVRGATKYLSSDTTTAETTLVQSLTAFNADGFSLGTDSTLVNANANSYVAWQWKEGIGNGLDIVTYTGNATNRTIAHNLGVAPAMVIVKRYDAPNTGNWQVRHTSIAAANSIQLNSTAISAAAATVWNSTAPTSSVFSVGTSADVNATGGTYVAYCFAEISGFSKFASYSGNGDPNGPLVFCGFRPRFVMIKRTDVVSSWTIFDSGRLSYNVDNNPLYADLPSVEGTTDLVDILSNGFKCRSLDASINASGGTYIFAAFAEVPSKYALAR